MMKFDTTITTERLILLIILIITGITSITTLLSWVIFIHPFEIIGGEGLVNTQITILGISTVKPITLLVISSFIFWMSGLEFFHDILLKLPKISKLLMIFFFVLVAFICTYENLWNFLTWTSTYILTQGNTHVDDLYHQPNQMNPRVLKPNNFVYATKKYALFTACSLYGMFFFYRLINVNIHKIPEG